MMVAGKQARPQWLMMEEAVVHCTEGIDRIFSLLYDELTRRKGSSQVRGLPHRIGSKRLIMTCCSKMVDPWRG